MFKIKFTTRDKLNKDEKKKAGKRKHPHASR